MANNNKNKGGAPKKAESEKASEVIQICVTKSVKMLIEHLQEEAGYKSRSKFLNNVFMQVLKDGKVVLYKQAEVSSQLEADINGLSNNINQITHKLHETGNERQYAHLIFQMRDLRPLMSEAVAELQLGRGKQP